MGEDSPRFLLHGIDTVQAAYYLQAEGRGLDFESLAARKEALQHEKRKDPCPVQLGSSQFLLQPYGTRSGYPFVLVNKDFRIECGPHTQPNFFVTFTSEALWRESAQLLHEKFLAWARSLGHEPFRREGLSRVDFCFDYHLPCVDFTADWFTTRSAKDSQHRENGKVQTFTFGKGDVVLRVYDKVVEIEQQSHKVWFRDLWRGQDRDVWRIEWQVRKRLLRRFDIRTFTDLEANGGDVLRYLAEEHDTLRLPSQDTNRSRWPLHPLWADLQERIRNLRHTGIYGVMHQGAALEERLQRLVVSMYGYLKRLAAARCVQRGAGSMGVDAALAEFGGRVRRLHEAVSWGADVQKRVTEIRLGHW